MTSPIKPHAIQQASSLCELFQRTVAARWHAPALRTPGGDLTITWRQYGDRVRRIAAGLASLGVGRGDTVALMMTNRPEFHLVDTAAYHLGATPFSVYNTSSPEQLSYLFANAGNKVIVCEEQFLPKIKKATKGSAAEHIVCVDGAPRGTTSLEAIEAADNPGFDFDATWRAVARDDILTLIYTSGTTGPPKGVELTHGNVLENIASGFDIPEFADGGWEGRVISYLPDAHAVNRWAAHWMPAVAGTTVTTVSDPKQLVEVLPQVRPTLFMAVPMLWYKIKAAIENGIDAEHGPKKAIAQWALEVGRRRVQCDTAGRPVPVKLAVQHKLAERVVLSKVAAKMGLDQVKIAMTGAAPIAPEALEFVLSLGIPCCEGWGMSELSALGTINRPGEIRPGTVGKPVLGMELTLADDGELLARGPNLMKGYRNDPEKTAEAVDAEGWLHTGDIATIDRDGYVRIVDRKKELIINSAGKNMSPTNIENAVKAACPLVGSVVAIGDQRKYVTALIALDADAAALFAKKQGLPDAGAEAVAPRVRPTIEAAIEKANSKLSRVEQVKTFAVLPTFWEPGGDELTPTMKLKRKPISEKYAAQIDAMYGTAKHAV